MSNFLRSESRKGALANFFKLRAELVQALPSDDRKGAIANEQLTAF